MNNKDKEYNYDNYYEQRIDSMEIEVDLSRKTLHTLKIERCLPFLPPGNLKLVDLGCGPGIYSRTLKKLRPEYEIFACDKSKVAIRFASKFSDGIKYYLCDVTDLPFEKGSFDIAVGFDIVEHLPNPEKIFSEIQRILKPNGLAHLFVPTEGNFLTLLWFGWKLFPQTLTVKIYSGHTRPIKTRDLIRWAKNNGLEVVNINYSYHFFGQMWSWLLMFPHKAKKILKIENRSFSGEKSKITSHKDRAIFFLKRIKDLLLNILEVIAYFEAFIFKNVRIFSMGTHITLRRKND